MFELRASIGGGAAERGVRGRNMITGGWQRCVAQCGGVGGSFYCAVCHSASAMIASTDAIAAKSVDRCASATCASLLPSFHDVIRTHCHPVLRSTPRIVTASPAHLMGPPRDPTFAPSQAFIHWLSQPLQNGFARSRPSTCARFPVAPNWNRSFPLLPNSLLPRVYTSFYSDRVRY